MIKTMIKFNRTGMKVRSSVALAILMAATNLFAQAPPEMAKEQPADPYAIGCLLPLSGKFAAAGSKTLDAIMMAFDIYKPDHKSPFKLVIEDTKGNPETAGAAVAKMVAEHRVMAILGPLGSAESQQAARAAQQLKVPIITFTQKEKITQTGDYVFRNFLTAKKQLEALASYAMNDAGMKRFAILYPEDMYGKEMARIFRSEVEKRKGRVAKSLSYIKGKADFGEEIKSLTAPSTVRKKRSRDAVQQEELKPEAAFAFDALFIPDNLAMLNIFAPQLAFNNLQGIKLLGTGYWNHAPAKKQTGEAEDSSADAAVLEGALFADGFSINSYVNEAGRFADAFYAAYEREPGTLEAMAYDAARISAAIIIQQRVTSREAFRDRLLNTENYTGATGKTSFKFSRDARKEVFILTVKDGQIIPLKSVVDGKER